MLFVYGTLRDPQLRAAVLGRPVIGLAAAAPGFATVHFPGRAYPALVRRPGARAPGLALMDLSAFEMDLLDAYEGEEYRRTVIPAMIGEELHQVFAYLPVIAVAGQPDWALETWQARHKARVLAGEQETAEALRRRLLAVRPH